MNITKQNITRAQKGAIAPLQYGKGQKLSSTKLVSFAIGFVLVLCTLASEFVVVRYRSSHSLYTVFSFSGTKVKCLSSTLLLCLQ